MQFKDGRLRKAARAARKAGWEITPTRGQHRKWTSPDGYSVYTSGTPSDKRAVDNILADLRKLGGLDV